MIRNFVIRNSVFSALGTLLLMNFVTQELCYQELCYQEFFDQKLCYQELCTCIAKSCPNFNTIFLHKFSFPIIPRKQNKIRITKSLLISTLRVATHQQKSLFFIHIDIGHDGILTKLLYILLYLYITGETPASHMQRPNKETAS